MGGVSGDYCRGVDGKTSLYEVTVTLTEHDECWVLEDVGILATGPRDYCVVVREAFKLALTGMTVVTQYGNRVTILGHHGSGKWLTRDSRGYERLMTLTELRGEIDVKAPFTVTITGVFESDRKYGAKRIEACVAGAVKELISGKLDPKTGGIKGEVDILDVVCKIEEA